MWYLRILVSVQYHTYLEGALLYASKKKSDIDIQSVFPNMHLWWSCTTIQKASSKEVKAFFQRALSSYTHKFPKHGAASLKNLLCLCSRALFETVRRCGNGSGFCKCVSIFFDAYRMSHCHGRGTAALLLPPELSKLDLERYKSPREKLTCILNCITILTSILHKNVSHLVARCPDFRGICVRLGLGCMSVAMSLHEPCLFMPWLPCPGSMVGKDGKRGE